MQIWMVRSRLCQDKIIRSREEFHVESIFKLYKMVEQNLHIATTVRRFLVAKCRYSFHWITDKKVYYFQHDWGTVTRTKNGFFKISKNDLPMLLEICRKPWIPIRNAAGALQSSISSEMLPIVFPNSSSKIPSWFVMKCGELKIRNILEEDILE